MHPDATVEQPAPGAETRWWPQRVGDCRDLASPLWSAGSGSFDGPRLRGAIVLRGWTVREFAVAADLTSASVYNALRGQRVRDRTALKIFRTLARREAMPVVD